MHEAKIGTLAPKHHNFKTPHDARVHVETK